MNLTLDSREQGPKTIVWTTGPTLRRDVGDVDGESLGKEDLGCTRKVPESQP